jgi:hypothetical protein
MGDDIRLWTAHDRDVPLATLQRAVSFGAVWSVDQEAVWAIRAIRIYPEAIQIHRDALDAVCIRLRSAFVSRIRYSRGFEFR